MKIILSGFQGFAGALEKVKKNDSWLPWCAYVLEILNWIKEKIILFRKQKISSKNIIYGFLDWIDFELIFELKKIILFRQRKTLLTNFQQAENQCEKHYFWLLNKFSSWKKMLFRQQKLFFPHKRKIRFKMIISGLRPRNNKNLNLFLSWIKIILSDFLGFA